KIVLRLAIEDDKRKRKALKAAAGVHGVDSVAVDMKEKRITVIGDVDPVYLTSKLKKKGFAELLVIVGPVTEEKNGGREKGGEENKAEVPKILYVPSSYHYEYSVVNDENPSACTI
ncbi:hypothetical protein KI387_010438, partial [Taxus chinensis]